MLSISQAAEDLIVSEEIGSKKLYEKRYRHPEWPGGASGITVGIGYDLGYQTRSQIIMDWGSIVPPEQILVMAACAGIKGQAAKDHLPQVKFQVEISYDQAMSVFENTDTPRWTKATATALPNCDALAPDCFGALVSISYNRGTSYNMAGDRYREMRAINQLLSSKQFDKIPAEIRSMKRLWTNGLVGRREREAQLFERGLAVMRGERVKPPLTREQEVVKTAATLGVGTGTAFGIAAIPSPKPSEIAGHEVAFTVAVVAIGTAIGSAVSLFMAKHTRLPKADA